MKLLVGCLPLCFLMFGSPGAYPRDAGNSDSTNVPTVRGLSVYGMDDEQRFPVILRDSLDRDGKPTRTGQYITIQFDVLADDPPPLKIKFYHCDRDWKPDENFFVQDELHNTSFVLEYSPAPDGVRDYSYRYINRFPDKSDVVRFDYSGKWMFTLLDRSETTVFGGGRFIVADRVAPTSVSVKNDYLTENSSPLNQVHTVAVAVSLPSEAEGPFFTAVDVVQNRRLDQAVRIDAIDRDPYTFVNGYGTGMRIFTVTDIYPGNEYRTLDLGNTTRYPNRSLVRPVEGADQMRYYWRTGPDRNGTAVMNAFTGVNSDYLEVLFRLDLTASDRRSVTAGGREIYLVGPFNQWEPAPEYRLAYDEAEHSLVTIQLLRRGVYDYQYVTGRWDEASQTVTQQNWLELEGNDWRTSNVYTALVYYNDPRFGGFDRIIGFGQTTSAGVSAGSR